MFNLTKSYPFNSMSVGDSFVVTSRFQHARVAASEYARRNNVVFTCRMQDDGTMIVYRVSIDQQPIDQRGRRGRRRITASVDPTASQFGEWLATFGVGQSYLMPASYDHLFVAMVAWCELFSLHSGRCVVAQRQGVSLLIRRDVDV